MSQCCITPLCNFAENSRGDQAKQIPGGSGRIPLPQPAFSTNPHPSNPTAWLRLRICEQCRLRNFKRTIQQQTSLDFSAKLQSGVMQHCDIAHSPQRCPVLVGTDLRAGRFMACTATLLGRLGDPPLPHPLHVCARLTHTKWHFATGSS